MGKSELNSKKIDSKYQGLFNLMHQEHGLKLIESEMQDIIDEVEKYFQLEYAEYLEEDSKNHAKILKLIREQDKYIDSQSPDPTCKESLQVHDMLIDGDWFMGTEEEYRKCFKIEGAPVSDDKIDKWVNFTVRNEFLVFDSVHICWIEPCKKTQLTPSEFLRRAENTFKK